MIKYLRNIGEGEGIVLAWVLAFYVGMHLGQAL